MIVRPKIVEHLALPVVVVVLGSEVSTCSPLVGPIVASLEMSPMTSGLLSNSA